MSLGAVLQHHLDKFPLSVAVDISEKLYVDNLLSGVENEADAISYFHEACDLMQKGNFVLRQWCTNSDLLRNEVHQHNTGTRSSTISILGLPWDTKSDKISFPVHNFDSTNTQLTTCHVLSMASKFYDPLGMLSPVTLVARLFIAKSWDQKFGWDQPLPPNLSAQWQSIDKDLNAASHLEFSRWELGVIQDLILGHDHLCCAAVVRTSKGHTTRSLVKLVSVELNISNKVIDNTEDTNDTTDSDVSERQQHVPHRAALNARDTIKAQLIDMSQD